jgi:hypothetical protein
MVDVTGNNGEKQIDKSETGSDVLAMQAQMVKASLLEKVTCWF